MAAEITQDHQPQAFHMKNWFEEALFLRHDKLGCNKQFVNEEHKRICDRESEVMDAIRDSITDEKTRKLLFELDELHGVESAIVMFDSYKMGIYDGIELAEVLRGRG